MRLSRRVATLLLTAGLAATALATAPSASAGPCAATTTKAISGIIAGADGRDVNVSIGFDVLDAQGRKISISDGCPTSAGYSAILERNHYVSGEGQPAGAIMYDAQGGTHGRSIHTWQLLNLPANAAKIWVEVYSRTYSGSPCTTCYGPADVHKYGYSLRRWLAPGTTAIRLVLPLTCSYGGNAGTISAKTYDAAGRPITVDSAYAWSLQADQNRTPYGWGSASKSSGGFTISSLAGAADYTMWVTYKGVLKKIPRVHVSACQTTPISVRF